MTAHDHAAKARALLKEAMTHLEDCKPQGVIARENLELAYHHAAKAVRKLVLGFGLEERRDEAA